MTRARLTASPALDALFVRFGAVRSYQPQQAIFRQGDPSAERLQVARGTACCCSYTPEGHRQISRFVGERDFLGCADLLERRFTAEAITAVVVRAIPEAIFEAEVARSPELGREVRGHVTGTLAALEHQLVMLSFATAEARVLWFLCALARGDRGFVRLPMTRQDIGDHLGLTVETVSRAFQALRRRGKVEVDSVSRYRVADPLATAEASNAA